LKQGPAPTISVREFLMWFDAQRRGIHVVRQIRESLAAARLKTVPDFEGEYIDNPISFAFTEPETNKPLNEPTVQPDTYSTDPTFRIGKLQAANKAIVSVKPNQKISEAITLMLLHDYSQLPVMTTDREVKGVISWKCIGSSLALGRLQPHSEVRSCMIPPQIV